MFADARTKRQRHACYAGVAPMTQRSVIPLARRATKDEHRGKPLTSYVAQRAISKRISGSGGSSGALAGRMTLITEPALTGVSVTK
jgi:hypothetical protein